MKIGIIGLGLRVAHIASDFKNAASEIEFVAGADPYLHPDIEATMRASGTLPINLYKDAGEMLSKETLDFLIISSPNSLHLSHIEAALQSDIAHIFVEKPVVTSIEDTMKLLALIQKHGGADRLTVGLVLRYSPLYRALLKSQKDGLLGELMSIEACEHIAPYHGSFFMRDWRRLNALSGGFMLEKCCHDLDLYQNLVGHRPRSVASFGGTKKYVPQHRPEQTPDYFNEKTPIWNATNDPYQSAELIDYQTALIEYADGTNLAFHTNINVPDEFRRFCVVGTDGMAEGDFIRGFYRATNAANSELLTDIDFTKVGDRKDHYGSDPQMARDVIAHIKGEPTGETVSIFDALEAGITALSIDIARNERRVVDLDEIWAEFDQYTSKKEVA